jgi:cell division protein ZapE
MLILDKKQIEVKEKLNGISSFLENKNNLNFFQKIFTTSPKIKSFYLYGGVGRGKTMLMKDFYNSLKKTPKLYFHFNAFMQQIHEGLHALRKEKVKCEDELVEVIKKLTKNCQVICFDEFQVVDIADAMLLSRIFSYIFLKEIFVVFTSNAKPSELYKNGLQREVFLEFVNKILLKNCDVSFLDSEVDYRSLYKENLSKRYFISNKKNSLEILNIIKNLTDSGILKPCKIKVWGREIKIKKTYKNIAVINFAEIFLNDLGVSDYRAICQKFDLIFLLKIPKLSEENINEARRLLLFIDEAYENKTALIISAKVAANKIYEKGIGFEVFNRAVSRINEIKSDFYWKGSKFFNF